MKDYSEIISTLRMANSWQSAPGYAAAMLAAADAIEELQNDYEILAKMYDKANENLTEFRAAQRWISVEDSMPELIPCKAGTAYSEAVLVITDNRTVMVAIYDGTDFIGPAEFWGVEGEEVTHWKSVLPLPEIPGEVKG